MIVRLHPFCTTCGWRKGGLDSWDGVRCKCGHAEAPWNLCVPCKNTGRIGDHVCRDCLGAGIVREGS